MVASVTVIIPTTLRPSLKAAIDSVKSQFFPPSRILVIVDTSDPNTKLLEHGGVEYVFTGNQSGPAVTRNQGLYLCETEWVSFLDDDDVWLPNHLTQLIEFCKNNRLDAAYSSAIVNGNRRPSKLYDGTTDPLKVLYSKRNWLKTEFYLPLPGLIVSRKVYSKLKFDSELQEREDLWFAHEMFANDFKIAQSPECSIIVNQERIRSISRTTVEGDLEWSKRLARVDLSLERKFLFGIALRNAILRRDWKNIRRISSKLRENV